MLDPIVPTQATGESTPAAGPPPASPRAPRRRWWPWILALGLVTLVAYAIFPRATNGEGKNPAAAGVPVVPVVVATARSGNVGVYLAGLGTVTPLSTVTIHTRVDGELLEVAFKEGQIVQKGDLLARIDPRPFEVQLMQAEGQRAKDEATLRNTQLDLVRYQDLFQRGIIPRQQVDTQIATVNQSEGALKSDQSQIDSARLNLEYSRIIAPVTGRVGLRLIDPGNIVHAADPGGLVVITQVSPISIVFTIPEDSLPQLLRQMRGGAGLPVEAFDRDAKTKLATGTLLTVDNQIDQTTGTVKVKTIFQNSKDELFPNQFVNARLLVDTIRNTVIVPTAAIQRSPQATFVYVVKPDKSVEMRNVEVRLTEGEDTAIKSGLPVGAVVVTDGVDKLQQGTRVAAR